MTDEFTVLFVCTANQCRSVMAEALAAHVLQRMPDPPPLTFGSAGTSALAGSPPTEVTARTLRIAGIDLAGHRSRELDRRIVADADLVLTMTRGHIAAVLAQDRSAGRRTFTLAGFARAVRGRAADSPEALVDVANEFAEVHADDDVPDPVGHGDAAHQICAARLLQLVRVVVAALAGSSETTRTP